MIMSHNNTRETISGEEGVLYHNGKEEIWSGILDITQVMSNNDVE
jgi:hypothetical protein